MSVYSLEITCSQCKRNFSELVNKAKLLNCPYCKSEILTIKEYSGYIYILSNESLPGILKIGCTERPLPARVKELSNSSKIPTPFVLEASYFSDNHFLDEPVIHEILSSYKVKSGKELYQISLKKAISLISESIKLNPCFLPEE